MGEKKTGARIELVPVKPAEYYTKREGFDPGKLLGSPMILVAILSLGAMWGIPKMLENSKKKQTPPILFAKIEY